MVRLTDDRQVCQYIVVTRLAETGKLPLKWESALNYGLWLVTIAVVHHTIGTAGSSWYRERGVIDERSLLLTSVSDNY